MVRVPVYVRFATERFESRFCQVQTGPAHCNPSLLVELRLLQLRPVGSGAPLVIEDAASQ